MIKYSVGIVVLFLMAGFTGICQDAKSLFEGPILFLELGANSGSYSVNVEHKITEIGKLHLTGRIGYGVSGFGESDFEAIPISLYLFNKNGNHHIEGGFGLSYIQGKELIKFQSGNIIANSALYFVPSLGYRFQMPRRSLFFRIVYTPLIKFKEFENLYFDEKAVIHSGGLSIGYFFANK